MKKYRYVLGFAIDKGNNRVLLIKKARPTWQEGLLNGIGGHIMEGELPYDAMVRKFHDETGIDKERQGVWHHYGYMQGPDWECYLFRSFKIDDLYKAQGTKDEPVKTYFIEGLGRYYRTVENVSWLVGAALNNPDDHDLFYLNVNYF